ncbi:diacylglycerol/lipid kinase family protein [Lacticaseibacillus saniviri]|nr:diacylglycerol kinase family protein [Lacticaseibacillus saniviri]MCG4280797.1 diacylglycerol kinase family lipid kinase [Lacticaseibacillus saniviri]
MTTMTIIYNPHAGHNTGEWAAKRLQSAVVSHGGTAELAPTKSAGDATQLARHAESAIVVAVGGDGTISEVVAGLVPRETPPILGIIPQGTVNNLARVLQIPPLPDLAIRNILTASARPIDVGQVNDHYMISTMTLGVLANVAVSVTQKEKQRFGPLAFLARGAKVLAQHQHWQLQLESPQHQWTKDTQLMLVTMTNSVGGFTNFAPQAKPDDGKFHVFVAPKLSIWHSLRALPYFLSGKFSKFPGMTYFTATELTVTANKKLRTRIDGDPSTHLPLEMKVISDHIRVLAPKKD